MADQLSLEGLEKILAQFQSPEARGKFLSRYSRLSESFPQYGDELIAYFESHGKFVDAALIARRLNRPEQQIALYEAGGEYTSAALVAEKLIETSQHPESLQLRALALYEKAGEYELALRAAKKFLLKEKVALYRDILETLG